MVLCEQIKVIDKNRLIKNITSLDRINMNIINRKINISLDLKKDKEKTNRTKIVISVKCTN